jgi:hypothetical protein
MDAVLASRRNFWAKATRREHLSVGAACEWILTLVSEQSDLTLDEIVSAHKKRIRGSRTALWRFFGLHGITVKKPVSGRTAASRRGSGASTLDS